MIQLKYVHLGSAVLIPSGVLLIKAIDANGVNPIDDGKGNPIYIDENVMFAIKITAPMLKQFGFSELGNAVMGWKYFHPDSGLILYSSGTAEDFYIKVNDKKIPVTSLHQMQMISLCLYNFEFVVADEAPAKIE